uniref:alpha-galactosidase n=1 Tax=Blastobotrys adeninivorans TaxID=409370 RepID=A0A060T9H5_BLAAD
MTVEKRIEWNTPQLCVTLDVRDDKTVWIRSVRPTGSQLCTPADPNRDGALPLVEVRLAGEGGEIHSSKRLIGSYFSRRLKYNGHKESVDGDTHSLDVSVVNPEGDIHVTAHFTTYSTIPVLRSTVTIKNSSGKEIVLQNASSMVIGELTSGSENWWDDYNVHFAHSSWFREAQWQMRTLPEVGLDDFALKKFGYECTRACFAVSNTGTFSTNGHLPMGALTKKDGTRSWLWQIEHSGSWRWEIGDYFDGVYVLAGGPTEQENHWRKVLCPGNEFTSVPVAMVVSNDNLERSFQILNSYRRRIRRYHEDNDKLPIIFNDYMNCLMGDPTTEKVEALIKPAADSGAEYFCIDCGWYSNDNGWWDTVGEWEPSLVRFPGGLKPVLDNIRKAGMIPGLWLEPEVIGVNSPIASKLPDEAFFCRDGVRVLEQQRYQLDYRHPLVIERMDKIVDNLVNNFGVGYFKFDYNIDVTQGTDVNSDSPGDGMLEHRRAYMKWVNALFDRHPGLVIESCSSGAQRLDYDLLSVHPLQSSSDQQDPVKYAAISGSIPTALTPEQNAVWAYPQAEWSNELTAFTVVNSLLGRVHLSGRLDLLNKEQLSIVRDGMDVYKSIRANLKTGQPFWPLGIPKWSDEWVSVGIESNNVRYLAVWKRSDSQSVKLKITGKPVQKAKLLYPAKFASEVTVSGDVLDVKIATNEPSARLYELQ